MIGIIATLLLSAWFAGSETVFLSFNKVFLPAWLRDQRKGALSVDFLIDRPERFLATTLTGNSIVNVLYSSLMTLYMMKYGFSENTVLVIAPLILLVIGEVIPKTIGRQFADRSVLFVGAGLRGIRLALYPLVWLLEISVGHFQKRLKLTGDQMGRILSRDEIKAALLDAEKEGDIPLASKPLIRGLVNISEKRISDIMTPRTAVIGIDSRKTVDEAAAIMLKSGVSRLPCYRAGLDDVNGYITAQSLLAEAESLDDVMIPLPMIPENVSVIRLLSWFRRKRTGFAGVIDEYGGFAGLVSMEDLIEEMIGPIQDEFDLTNPGMWKIADRIWIINARTRLSQIALYAGFDPGKKHSISIGGLVTELSGDIPKVGKVFELEKGYLKVLRADPRGVRLVRLTLKETTIEPDKS